MSNDPWSYAKDNSEHSHQVALFKWLAMAQSYGIEAANFAEAYNVKGWAKEMIETALAVRYPPPELRWLHAVKNQGHGDAIRGNRSRAEGVKPGVLDMFLPVPRPVPPFTFGGRDTGISRQDRHTPNPNIYCGLYVEMKLPKHKHTYLGGLSEEQDGFARFARIQGYDVVVCYSWIEARDAIMKYLGA